MHPKYEEDLSAWAHVNAMLLKERKFEEADMEHIIEELESLGISNKRELINRLATLLCHLLKWQYQPNLQSKSWQYTAEEQRYQIQLLLKDNPSLKSIIDNALKDAYGAAKIQAQRETGLVKSAFPSECPYTLEQCLEENFYPL